MTFLLMALSVRVSRHWRKLEDENLVHCQEQLQEMNNDKDRSCLRKMVDFSFRRKHAYLLEVCQFHKIRSSFVHSNQLDSDFAFSAYLKKCSQHVFLKLGALHSTTYMVLLCAAIFDIFLRSILFGNFNSVGFDSDFTYYQVSFATYGIILSILPCIVHYKTKSIYQSLLYSKLLDFDASEAKFFLQHWVEEENNIGVSRTRAGIHKLRPESNRRMVARLYQIKHESPRRSIQTSSNAGQLELFWFGSHLFLIRILQCCTFLFIIYASVLIQFEYLFFDFSSGTQILLSVMMMLPLAFFICFIPSTIPTYTLIIHVGQMVDLQVVEEAMKKASKTSEERSRTQSKSKEQIKPEAHEKSSVPRLSREETLLSLSSEKRLRYKLTGHLFGNRWENILSWLCITDLVVIGLYMTIGNSTISNIIGYIHQIIAIGFLLEFALKVYAIRNWASNSGLLLDGLAIVINFVVSVLCTTGIVDLKYGIVVVLRLLNAVRVPHVGKIILENLDKKLDSLIPASCLEGEDIERRKKEHDIIDRNSDMIDSENEIDNEDKMFVLGSRVVEEVYENA